MTDRDLHLYGHDLWRLTSMLRRMAEQVKKRQGSKFHVLGLYAAAALARYVARRVERRADKQIRKAAQRVREDRDQ